MTARIESGFDSEERIDNKSSLPCLLNNTAMSVTFPFSGLWSRLSRTTTRVIARTIACSGGGGREEDQRETVGFERKERKGSEFADRLHYNNSHKRGEPVNA
jgi:hypothetical protein